MKCKFCGAELLVGKDKCDFCGKYQHDYVNNDEEKQDNNDLEQKKEHNIGKIILLFFKIAIVLGIILVAGYFILDYINNMEYIYGDWRCTNDQLVITNITIDKNNFKMKNNSNGYREASYILEKKVKEDDNTRYYLNVSASKRLANGLDYVDSDETKFELLMSDDNHNEYILTNTITGAEYKCYIEK